jgi:hypothetical protein
MFTASEWIFNHSFLDILGPNLYKNGYASVTLTHRGINTNTTVMAGGRWCKDDKKNKIVHAQTVTKPVF